ncbi:hypothetical protein CDAR_410021 [Caerostris darwini]|uniref:Uncharacterized protein n=1 Tax=Caerostris darwini TaxID=1538125 RepID=A0AAV4VXQ2_9ARAC|nr:hypothetical protein CDAR_410021 [Caerostris darwini]
METPQKAENELFSDEIIVKRRKSEDADDELSPEEIEEKRPKSEDADDELSPDEKMDLNPAPDTAKEATKESNKHEKFVKSLLESLYFNKENLQLPVVNVNSGQHIRKELKDFMSLRKSRLQLLDMKGKLLDFLLENFVLTLELRKNFKVQTHCLQNARPKARTLQAIKDRNVNLKEFAFMIAHYFLTLKQDHKYIMSKFMSYSEQSIAMNSDIYQFLTRLIPEAFEKWAN